MITMLSRGIGERDTAGEKVTQIIKGYNERRWYVLMVPLDLKKNPVNKT